MIDYRPLCGQRGGISKVIISFIHNTQVKLGYTCNSYKDYCMTYHYTKFITQDYACKRLV